jgi:hypothetical protein
LHGLRGTVHATEVERALEKDESGRIVRGLFWTFFFKPLNYLAMPTPMSDGMHLILFNV